MGYSYNSNPIDDSVTLFNVSAPLIIEHTLYAGASQKITESFILSFAYIHAFENSIQGPIITPSGCIPGSTVQSRVSADALVLRHDQVLEITTNERRVLSPPCGAMNT